MKAKNETALTAKAHVNDVAADVTFASGTPQEWDAEGDRLLPQGGVGRYKTFVHVDNRTSRARWTGAGVS